MKNNTFHEVFEKVSNAPIKKDKIAILHEYSSPALKAVLGYAYDPRVVWQLPKTDPPYKPLDEAADQETRLAQEIRKLYLFANGPGPINQTQANLKSLRRESLFIEMLENVDHRDAKVLLMMKNGKLLYKGLTRNLVAEAFPNLTKDWPNEEDTKKV